MQPQQGMAAPAVGPAPVVGPSPAVGPSPINNATPVSPAPNQAHLDPAYQHTGMATASLVLGIVSLPASLLNILSLPIPITAIVLGAVSLKRKKGFALAGIVLGVIGIILSVVMLIVGLHILNNKNKTNPLKSVSAASGASVSSSCFTFSLPAEFKSSDIESNTNCSVSAANSNGDVEVGALPPLLGITAANSKATLKSVIDQAVASQLAGGHPTAKVTGSDYLKMDGVDAYESHGTETGGYFAVLAVVPPKNYTGTDGSTFGGFLIGYDSRTNPSGVEQIVKSWHWQ